MKSAASRCQSDGVGCLREDCGWPDQPCVADGSDDFAGASDEEVGPVGNDGRASDPSAAQGRRHIEEARYLLDRHDSGQAGFLRPHELAAIRYLLDARRQEDSTMRVLIAALRETLRLFWHAPGETVAMTVTHVLGDKGESQRWYEKAKAKADRA